MHIVVVAMKAKIMAACHWFHGKHPKTLRSHICTMPQMVSDLPGSPNFRHNDDQVLLDGSAEARTGSLNKEMGQTSVQPETYSNLEPTKQLSKNGSIFEERPMSE
jgi:hypothetical protein